MGKWKYKLNEGVKLRELIDGDTDDKENQALIIEQIIVCCKALLEKLDDKDKEYYQMELEDLINVMDGEGDYIRNGEDLYESFYSTEELADARLAEFYDICDACRCWIDLN